MKEGAQISTSALLEPWAVPGDAPAGVTLSWDGIKWLEGLGNLCALLTQWWYQRAKTYFSVTSFAFGLNKRFLWLLQVTWTLLSCWYSTKSRILTGKFIHKLLYVSPAQIHLFSTWAEIPDVLRENNQKKKKQKNPSVNLHINKTAFTHSIAFRTVKANWILM